MKSSPPYPPAQLLEEPLRLNHPTFWMKPLRLTSPACGGRAPKMIEHRLDA